MTYTLYSGVNREQCLEWIDRYKGIPVDERWVMTKVGGDDQERVLARMFYGGEHYAAHFKHNNDITCFTNGSHFIKWKPCQLLRVREGCTTAFVSYKAGDVLPYGAVAVSNLAQHEIRYIVAVEMPTNDYRGWVNSGLYTEGADRAKNTGEVITYSTDMKLVIVIWGSVLYKKWHCHNLNANNIMGIGDFHTMYISPALRRSWHVFYNMYCETRVSSLSYVVPQYFYWS